MKNVIELREKRAKIVHDAREMLDTARAEGRSLDGEAKTKFDELMDKADALKTEIEQEERVANLEREALETANVRASEENREATDDEVLEERAFAKALMLGVSGLSPEEQRALQFDDSAGGGYLSAPEQFVARLIKAVDDQVVMRQIATVLPPLREAHSIGAPSLDSDPNDADWTAELTAASEDTNISFGKREMMPHLVSKLVKMSMKLLRQSAISAEQIVMDRLAHKFAVTWEKAYLTGTGANQPLGIFTAHASGISTARDISTGNTSTSLTFDGLKEAKYGVKGQYQQTGRWLFHRDGVKMLAKLKDGEGRYIWQPGVVGGEGDTLLQRPVIQSEFAPNTFTTGQYVGMFGDFSHYWIIDSLGLSIQRLNELYAGSNQVGYIGRAETDGAPVLEEAFSRIKLA